MVQENSLKNKILIICGATASGKTALSIECAKLLNSEVISADSMNVYKGLDIGTAKPNLAEMCGVKHHLIDVVDSNAEFSVGDYKSLAEKAILSLFNENKTPVICGGTGFYINSILYNLSYGNSSANIEVREKYKLLAQQKGNEYVYLILKEKDPISAEKLHYNDVKRVIRALEICESGIKKSDILDSYEPKYDYKAFAIDFPREELYQRINKRVDIMIDNGLVQEIERLLDNGVTKNHQCMQGIGYKEIYEYLVGEVSLADAVENIKINTRHYAKRQITYFKKLPGLIWLKPNKADLLAKRIIEEL